MTESEAVAAVKAGGRCETGTTIHGLTAPAVAVPCSMHRWRTVACDNFETDVIECQGCGEQRTCPCDFDDDFS